MIASLRVVVVFTLLATHATLLHAQWTPEHPYTFVERDGVVAIEAEHFTDNVGPWELVEGRTATLQAAEGLGQDPLAAISVVGGGELAGGLSGEVVIGDEARATNWGAAGPEAIIVATQPGRDDRAVIFAYEEGAAMPGLVAPARRVGVFQGHANLAPEAWQLFTAAADWASDGSKDVLFVASSTEPGGNDREMIRRLEAAGYGVTIEEAGAVQSADAAGHGLVFVSESVGSGEVADKFKEVDVPVMIAEPYVYDDMGMVVRSDPWQEGPGQSGNAMLIRNGAWTDFLRYAIYFEEPGTYNVWLMGQSGGDGGSDEVKIFFEPDAITSESDFYEMRLPGAPGWSNVMHYKTAANPKTPGEPTVEVQEPGWHSLYLVKGAEPENPDDPPVGRRYPNWRVDRILLTSSDAEPVGDVPEFSDALGVEAAAGEDPHVVVALAVEDPRGAHTDPTESDDDELHVTPYRLRRRGSGRHRPSSLLGGQGRACRLHRLQLPRMAGPESDPKHRTRRR